MIAHITSHVVEYFLAVAYLGILFGGVQQIQLRTKDRENGDLGGGSPLVRGSGGSYNLVQEISFHIVKIFLTFVTLRLFMTTTNLFVIANVKPGSSFRILLPFSEHLEVLAS